MANFAGTCTSDNKGLLLLLIADGWLPLRSSEGLSSSLLRCSVISIV